MTDPVDQYFSPYTYVGNNPIIFIDKDGMMSGGPGDKNPFMWQYKKYNGDVVHDVGVGFYNLAASVNNIIAPWLGLAPGTGDVMDVGLALDYTSRGEQIPADLAFALQVGVTHGQMNLADDFNDLVMFGQKGISEFFSKKGTFKGAPIASVVERLKSGDLTPDDLPLEYVVINGQKVTMNNRSLAALSAAGIFTFLSDAGSVAKVQARLDEMGGMPSTTIPVRDGQGTVIEIVK